MVSVKHRRAILSKWNLKIFTVITECHIVSPAKPKYVNVVCTYGYTFSYGYDPQ